ncbi:MAG: chorismate synthase [Firmicutes bacterium]|nr:chorismate synthase [Bacillota bacterium]
MLRYLTAGESHGPGLSAIVEGIPAGLHIQEEVFNEQLARRQTGFGRGGRMKIEQDRIEVHSGVRFGVTLGTPIALWIPNRDYVHWEDRMRPFGQPPEEVQPVTRPRPGHADLAGALKYGHRDLRNVLERASARETAMRVAVGALARALLAAFGIQIAGRVLQIGSVRAPEDELTLEEMQERSEASAVRCTDPDASEAMVEAIRQARLAGDTLGGRFEVVAFGVLPGLGSYAQWDRRLDGRLAQAMMSIQAIKAVEIGAGNAVAQLPGSQVHDPIFWEEGKGYLRPTNRAGGIEGGVSNGEKIVVRAAMKPIPTLNKPLQSVDMATHTPFLAQIERSDACSVPAASVVAEGVVAWELACAMVEKFGGDSIEQMQQSVAAFRREVADR